MRSIDNQLGKRVGKTGRFCFLLWLCLSFFPALSHAEFVALVIGNNNYSTAPLQNPANDAKVVAKIFERMGYDHVELLINADTADLDVALQQFSVKAAVADVAVIYYAGHGVQIDGRNYAVPLDVALDYKRDVNKLVSQQDLTDEVARAQRFGLVILDACRDNPFAKRIASSRNRSSASRGLARERDTAFNTVVAYATAADDTAADGDGDNSPYTAALIEHMDDPTVELYQLLGKVKDSVFNETDGEQQPSFYTALGGERYFLHPKGYELISERDEWLNTTDIDTVAGYMSFLDSFPEGKYAGRAERELEQFSRLQTASITIDDLHLVSSQFENLRKSFQQKKWSTLLVSSAISDSARTKIARLQENRSDLNFIIENVRAREKTQTIYADIVAQRRSDGVEYETFPLSVNRNIKGAWSLPSW